MPDDSEELVHLLIHLTLQLREHEGRCLEQLGMTHSQARALWAVRPGQTTTVRALADSIRGDPSNLSTALGELERRGLVERTPSPHDRRARALRLTSKGRSQRAQLVACLEPPAVAALMQSDRQRLIELLREIDRGLPVR